jgi:hypothetical protein
LRPNPEVKTVVQLIKHTALRASFPAFGVIAGIVIGFSGVVIEQLGLANHMAQVHPNSRPEYFGEWRIARAVEAKASDKIRMWEFPNGVIR